VLQRVSRDLEINGVGYRAEVKKVLVLLSLFSPANTDSDGISVVVEKMTGCLSKV
jgi:hypothetical protein